MEFCRVYHEIKPPTNRVYGKPEITGKITFTPDLQKGEVWTDKGVVVPALPITCEVIDGKMYDNNGEYPSRYVYLMAGSKFTNPPSMHWRVSYHDMRIGGDHFYIDPFIFKAEPRQTFNLSEVTPVAGYTPPGIIRGGVGQPGTGIVFDGVVPSYEDLPEFDLEPNKAYAVTGTRDLAVWKGDEWEFIPNFANVSVELEDMSDWMYEVRKNVEFSREERQKMEELKKLAEKYAYAGEDYMKLSMIAADGKSTISYGKVMPETSQEGDTWFKELEDGTITIMQYVDGKWVEQVDVAAMDKELADNAERVKEAQDAVNKLETETLPALRAELDNLDTVTALEVADKLATLETKLANADVALKQELQGELTALDEALSGDLTTKLAGLKEELEALDTDVAREAADKLAALETKLTNADVALKQELQGELTALDEALSGDLTTKLSGLREELVALDTDVAREAADKLAALETKLANADVALKQELQGELTALDEALSGDLTTKLSSLKGELEAADTAAAEAVATTLTQLENRLKTADETVKSDLAAELAAARKALEDADDTIVTDLSKNLEDARKDLKNASDTIATDLAEVDSVVSRQRPGNLFPDPFFKHPLWASRYNATEESLVVTANGNTNGVYYFPDGYNVFSHLMTLEPGASYLLTVDARFGGGYVLKQSVIYCRYLDAAGVIQSRVVGRIDRTNEVDYKWGTTSVVLQIPADVASEATLGFYVSKVYSSGAVQLRNVRLHRAADDSLIIDGAVTAAKVKAGVIDTDHIAAGAIVATRLAANSVVAGKIAANAVVADSIASNQITTAKIAADAITANKIATDAVLAKNIKAGQITTAKLAADAVTANKIAAGAISARELMAEDATIDKLWTNGIAAKSIVTNKLLVADNGNLLPEISSYTHDLRTNDHADPYRLFGYKASDPSMWIHGEKTVTIFHPMQMEEGVQYRIRFQVRASVDGATFYIQLQHGNIDGTGIGSSFLTDREGTRSSYLFSNQVANREWLDYSVTFRPEEGGHGYLKIFGNHSRGVDNSDGYQWFKDLRVEKITGATLIEDGAITTDKIAAKAVTANAIAANAVTADAIKAGEVAAKHLAADAVSATKLLAEDATIDKLWANGLAAKSITASRLTVSPGNMFPDPDFKDPSWGDGDEGTAWYTDSITLSADGTQNGVYLQPEGKRDAAMQHTPGVNYLLTANLRFGGNANIEKFSVYTRCERDTGSTGIIKVGEFVRFPTDGQPHASYRYMDNSTVLDFSNIKMAAGGYFTLGFFVERSETSGSVSISNVRLTPMSGTTLIEDGAITTGKIATNAITANKVAAGEILAEHIKAGEILAEHIKAGEISTAKIASDAITAAKIASDAVTANNIATGQIQAKHIKAGEITTDKIATSAIITKHIGAGEITANKLAADSVTANAIAAGEITSEKLSSGSVTASKLLAEDATIDKLWTNGIAAKSIVTNKLLVADNGNLLPEISSYNLDLRTNDSTDPYYLFGYNTSDPSMWIDGDRTLTIYHPMQMEEGVQYRIRFQVRASVDGSTFYMQLRHGDIDGPGDGTSFYFDIEGTRATYLFSNEVANRGWLDYSVTFRPEESGIAYLRVFGNHWRGADNSDGYQWFKDLRVEKMYGATLIEDGAITTGKIATDAIVSNHIGAGEITSGKIATDAIVSNHIGAGEITSDKLTVENGFIKTAMIENGAITNAKVGNLNAGKLTSGEIDANRIGAGKISAAHLATDSILSRHIKADEINGAHIAANVINSNHIRTDEILAKHIKSGEIKAEHIAADTIEAKQIKAEVFTQVATNVIPLIPGTTTPAWTGNADSTGTSVSITGGDNRYYRFNGTRYPSHLNLVEVDPDIDYFFSVWVNGTRNSHLFIEVRDQNGNHAVQRGAITGYTQYDKNGVSYAVSNLRIQSGGWRYLTTKLRLHPEVRFVRIGAIYGNHPNGVDGYALLADMRMHPDTASKELVDTRQDEAIDRIETEVDQIRESLHNMSATYNATFAQLAQIAHGTLRDGDSVNNVITVTAGKIYCHSSWTGYLTVVYLNSRGESLVVNNHNVTGSSREFSIASKSGGAVVHWFRSVGQARSNTMNSGARSTTSGNWTTIATRTVRTGSWNINATVTWNAATHENRYGIRILTNGYTDKTVGPVTKLGPLTPIGNGRRTQSISSSGNGNNSSIKFDIQVYTNATGDQGRIHQLRGTLDWTQL